MNIYLLLTTHTLNGGTVYLIESYLEIMENKLQDELLQHQNHIVLSSRQRHSSASSKKPQWSKADKREDRKHTKKDKG